MDASSTHIMIRNILMGFKPLHVQVIFLAIVDKNCSCENIKYYYSSVVDEIFFLNRISETYGSPLKKMVSTLNCFFSRVDFRFDGLDFVFNNECCIVSHARVVDSVLYAKSIKKMYPNICHIEYWSDPITLSLKTVKEYSRKRCLLRYIENRMLEVADKIVYGTKSLYDAQRVFFKKHSQKMGYCDVCYTPKSDEYTENSGNDIFGYLGNYYSSVRNIQPLYNAFKRFAGGELIICGSGNVALESTPNITVRQRLPQSEILSLEKKIDIEICILNKVGFQIPGKVFYETDTNKKILVILDGPVKKEIYEYLNQFRRFIFCENNEESILQRLEEISMGKYDEIDKSQIYRLTPQAVCQSILDGGCQC